MQSVLTVIFWTCVGGWCAVRLARVPGLAVAFVGCVWFGMVLGVAAILWWFDDILAGDDLAVAFVLHGVGSLVLGAVGLAGWRTIRHGRSYGYGYGGGAYWLMMRHHRHHHHHHHGW